MKYTYDHDYHIHSNLSLCCHDKGLDPERILLYARNRNLTSIAITDHFWDERVPGASEWYSKQDFAHISKAKPLPEYDGIKFYFGCEVDMDKFGTVGLSKERFDEFDFVLIPTTHLHMKGFTISEEDAGSLERRGALWFERLDKLFSMDLPFHKIGIPHLTCALTVPGDRKGYLELLSSLDEKEMERVFSKAAELGVGIEINAADFNIKPEEYDIVARMYRIAKDKGCKFFLGSDCHAAVNFCYKKAAFELAVDLIGLEESDKFILR